MRLREKHTAHPVGAGEVAGEVLQDLLLCAGFLESIRNDSDDAAAEQLRHVYSQQLPCKADPVGTFNQVIARGLEGSSRLWEDCLVATGRWLVDGLTGSRRDLVALPPARFTVNFRRLYNASRVPKGTAIRARLPLPIEDEHLSELKVAPLSGIDVVRKPTFLEAKLPSPGVGRIEIGAVFNFLARAGTPQGSADEDVKRWLLPDEGLIRATAKVRSLAAQLRQPGAPAFEQVMVFREYLIDTMACGMVPPECYRDRHAVDWAIESGWFDCRIGAALLASLCRATGIPARLVGGYLLWDAPTEHYWMEAWVPGHGWTPFDLLAWDLSAGGKDREWRALYAGALDYRMKTQIFPDDFTGHPGVGLGDDWQRVWRAIPNGAETRFLSGDGEPIYADRLEIFKK